MHGRGHVWQGGMHGRGACMAGGACVVGGHAWQVACMVVGHVWWGGECVMGACMAAGMHGTHMPPPVDTMRYSQ